MPLINKNKNLQVLIVGASQGIGLGFVNKLLENSNIKKIYATYRRRDSASELIALEQKFTNKIELIPLDITDELQICAGIDQIKNQTDKLHLVINCVGLLHDNSLQPEKSLKHINKEQLLRYFEVNSIGSVLLAKHLTPLFRHQEGSIFAEKNEKIGSIGDNKLGGWYGYRASKAALNMFMVTVGIEYQRTSPKTIVVTLHPGTTDTQLSQPFQKNVPPENLFSVERSVTQLLAIIDNLEIENSGQFFSWDGSVLPW